LTGQKPAPECQSEFAERVVFYRRFERLLGKLGLARPRGQTQREFAAAVQGPWDELLPAAEPASSFPQMVVDAFYRVRFGNQQLDAAEESAIDEGLARLEQHVVRRDSPHRV
jgi:protein-glutamine gamma-glutamyltransferase